MIGLVDAYIARKRFEAQLFFSALLPEQPTRATASNRRRGNSGRVYESLSADAMLRTMGVSWH